MKTPEKDNLTIYLLDIGENDQLVWCNDPDPGAGMDKDDAVGPYYHDSLLKDDKWLADNGLVKMASGCHVDGLKGIHTYDDCVIDSGDYEQCRYAHMGIAKEDCKYWREIK